MIKQISLSIFGAAIGVLLLFSSTLNAQQNTPPALQNVGIDQELNRQVPLNLSFRDEAGKNVKLGDYFGKRPVVLSLVYFNCPFICTDVLNGELSALRAESLALGRDYEAVTVSFDPHDGPRDAAAKSRTYSGLYGRPKSGAVWHFLTGDQASIAALTDAVGFHYTYDSSSEQFAHATTIVVLTPEGRVARYFFGVHYPTRDLRLALVEASEGRIGTLTDAALLFCYHYDPETGKYGLVIRNVLRLSATVTILILGIALWLMFRRENYAVHAPHETASASGSESPCSLAPGPRNIGQ